MSDLNIPVVPVTSLPISQKHTTIVVEPTAFVDGFEAESYDAAEITSMIWLNNPVEQYVEIPIPYSTNKFSASIAVISAGPDEFEDRLTSVKEVKGDLQRFRPYLERMGVPAAVLDDKKQLKELMEGFRVAVVLLPQRNLVLKLSLSAVIDPVASDPARKTFSFKGYAPLPSFIAGGGHVSLKMMVVFKNLDSAPKSIQDPVVTNPFGDNVNDLSQTPIVHDVHGDRIYAWRWNVDPVVEFTYTYN